MDSTQAKTAETAPSDRTRQSNPARRIRAWDWVRGAVGGFIGSVAFGLFMAFVMPPPLLEVVIPNMYGFEATPENPAMLAGWFFHQFHGTVLGLVYVAYAEAPSPSSWADPRTVQGGVVHGLIWGVITAVVLAVLVMPLWLQAIGFSQAPPFPNLSFPGSLLGLIGHLLYALPLGIYYALYRS